MLSDLFSGFSLIIMDPNALMWCLIGITIGTLVGALPGIGPVTGIAVLLPLSFGLGQLSASLLLVSIYLGSMYGGRISSILINVPGDGGAIVTTFDGYPLTQKGRAGYALTLSAIASFIGGVIGLIGLTFLTSVLAGFATKVGTADFASLIFFALVITCILSQKNLLKPIIAMFIGLLISSIGTDTITGAERLTFGILDLWDGINLAVVAIGVFGLSETLVLIEKSNINMKRIYKEIEFSTLFPKIKEVTSNIFSMIRGAVIGFFCGVLPGTGETLATFLSYSTERQLSKHPEKFGTGVPQGLSGPESANNAAVGGALIPTLALGIPGSGTAAILLGGFILIGLQPGPMLFEKSGDIVWSIFAGLFIANFLLLIMNVIFVPFFATLIQKAQPYLAPLIAAICFIGAYMIQYSLFDVGLLIFLGVFAYFMRKAGFPLAPLFLGVILGPLLEDNIRTALSISHGNISVFFTRPISLFFIILSLVVLLWPLIKSNFSKKAHTN